MTVAFCVVTRRVELVWLRFLEQVRAEMGCEVLIIPDEIWEKDMDTAVRVVYYDSQTVKAAGYRNACVITLHKEITAWDKAIYHFCEVEREYDQVYIVEDDVLIPSVASILSLQEKYPTEDLLCHCDNGFYEKDNGNIHTWLWKHAMGKLALPWYASMVCAIRVSNKLLECMRRQVREVSYEIPFIEIAWNTLAHQNGLCVRIIPEFEYIIYRPTSLDSKNYMQYLQQKGWLHPIKRMSEHEEVRSSLL